jgi:hypothetical protein
MTKMLLGYRCAEDIGDGGVITADMEQTAHERLRSDFAFIGLTEVVHVVHSRETPIVRVRVCVCVWQVFILRGSGQRRD